MEQLRANCVSLRKSWIRSFKFMAYFEALFFPVGDQEPMQSLEGSALSRMLPAQCSYAWTISG